MHRIRRVGTIFFFVACAAGIIASSASAFPSYTYSYSFGSAGKGHGQFEQVKAAATDAEGNLWVADRNRLQEFNAKGEYVREITKGIFSLNPSDVAIDSKGNVWATDGGGERVVKFSPTGTYLAEFGGEFGQGNGQFWFPGDIAIDSKGNLWVTDIGNHRIQEFNSEGKYLRQFGKEGTGNGQFEGLNGIAIDAGGHVWVADSTSGGGRIQEFSSEGAYLGQIGLGQLNEPYGDALSIDAEGNFWVADTNDNCVKVFNSIGEKLTQFGGVEVAGEMIQPMGFAFDQSGNPWVVMPSHFSLQKWIATPGVTTEAATSIKPTAATLNGTINPHGTSTTYQFEYGTTVSYGSKAPASPASAGAGTVAAPVSQAISGLKPNTTYHFRVVASSAAGTVNGLDRTFQTGTQWSVAGSALTGSAGYTGKVNGALTFSTGIGGNPIALTATGVELLESSIANEGGQAVGATKIRFTGVTTSGLGGCVVPGGTITTVPLKPYLVPINGQTYEVFRAGSGTGLFTWTLAKGTSSCSLSGSYLASGEIASLGKGLGTETVTQELSFSQAIQETVHEFYEKAGIHNKAEIHTNMGPQQAFFTGSISESLTGSYAGQAWSAF